jgi:hypothetical protein
LASNHGRVISSSRLVDYAWGHEGGHPSLIRTHISHIRAKLALPARGPGSIEVIPMVGYRLTIEGAGRKKSQPRTSGGDSGAALNRCDVRAPLRMAPDEWAEIRSDSDVRPLSASVVA